MGTSSGSRGNHVLLELLNPGALLERFNDSFTKDEKEEGTLDEFGLEDSRLSLKERKKIVL